MSMAPRPPGPVRPAVGGTAACVPVLLVVGGGMVSRPAISRVTGLAAGAQVIVVGVGTEDPGDPAAELVRRAVARAMSALNSDEVVALGHIAAVGLPSRAIARMARARGARTVVLDQPSGLAAGLAGELRRRLHGSGIAVIAIAEPAGHTSTIPRQTNAIRRGGTGHQARPGRRADMR